MIPSQIDGSRKPVGLIIFGIATLVAVIIIIIFYLQYAAHNEAKKQAQTVQKVLTQPGTDANLQAVRQDVASAAVSVQAYLTTQASTGETVNYGAVPVHPSLPGETLQVVPQGSGFLITATLAKAHFSYTYNSATGAYTSGTA